MKHRLRRLPPLPKSRHLHLLLNRLNYLSDSSSLGSLPQILKQKKSWKTNQENINLKLVLQYGQLPVHSPYGIS